MNEVSQANCPRCGLFPCACKKRSESWTRADSRFRRAKAEDRKVEVLYKKKKKNPTSISL